METKMTLLIYRLNTLIDKKRNNIYIKTDEIKILFPFKDFGNIIKKTFNKQNS